MKLNQWTIGLAAAGVVSLGSVVQADELTKQVLAAASATTISGYVNTAAHWNIGTAVSTSAYANGGGGSKDDGFNLNVVDLKISKPLDEGQWAAGYTAELWFGPDANTLNTTSVSGSFPPSDFAIKQAFVTLRVPVGNGLDFKMGVFDTITGYETFNAGDNPNYTRSWGNTIEPTEHTGLLASYKFNDIVSLSLGIANTTDSIINGRISTTVQSIKTYMGGITLTAPESAGPLKGATLTGTVIDGRPTGGGAPDTTWFYVGATLPTPVEGLAVGVAYDHVNLSDHGTAPTSDSDVVAAYISFKATDKLKLNCRLDYFLHVGDIPGFSLGGAAPFIRGDEFVTTTITADYALWANVISRVEYRWDHDLNKNGGDHFGSGTRQNDHLLALNVIYKF